MLWPDMLWFWIIAYDVWNFAYTYNCLPGHSWYCGLALLINAAVFVYMIYKAVKTKRNPYKAELYTDLQAYKTVKALAE